MYKLKLNEAELQMVIETILSFNEKKNYQFLLEVILNKMMLMTRADAGTIYVVQDDYLHFMIVKNISLNIYEGSVGGINLPPIKLDEKNVTNIAAYSAINNKLIFIDDVYQDSNFNFSGPKNYDKITGYCTKSMLVFPLATTENEVIGVIQLINSTDIEKKVTSFKGVFNEWILIALASVAANALSNIEYAKEAEETLDSFIRVMSKAIDERSSFNSNHTKNVAKYCSDFADYLSFKYPVNHEFYFNENRKRKLIISAFLHDIGKIITPLEVMDKKDRLGNELETIRYKFYIKELQTEKQYLANDIKKDDYKNQIARLKNAMSLIEEINVAEFFKDEYIDKVKDISSIMYVNRFGKEEPILTSLNIESLMIRNGTLTDDERKIMQEHVSITIRLLREMNFNQNYKDVLKWAGGHHELLDGSGYPYGLSEDEITIEMAILTIADIFDALSAKDRPYKNSVPIDKIFIILHSMAKEGKLHKELVELFIENAVRLKY